MLSLTLLGIPYQKALGFIDSLEELVEKTETDGVITITPQIALVGDSLFLDYEAQLAYFAVAKPQYKTLLRRQIRFVEPIEVIDHFQYKSREKEVFNELYRLARAKKKMIEELYQRTVVIFK